MTSTINYVIYHRNNRQLELTNHIEPDGDLDPNYTLIRNRALTGIYINDEFVSQDEKSFKWLIECAKTQKEGQYCPICSGIFEDALNNNYKITKFYRDNVVDADIPHPLLDEVIKVFKNKEK